MRMVKQDNASFEDRTHKSEKRAGGKLVQLEPGIDVSANGAHEFLALHDGLDCPRDFDERRAAVLVLSLITPNAMPPSPKHGSASPPASWSLLTPKNLRTP
jgi:hypothetical protein